MRRQTQTVYPFRSFIYSFPTQQDCVFPVVSPRKFDVKTNTKTPVYLLQTRFLTETFSQTSTIQRGIFLGQTLVLLSGWLDGVDISVWSKRSDCLERRENWRGRVSHFWVEWSGSSRKQARKYSSHFILITSKFVCVLVKMWQTTKDLLGDSKKPCCWKLYALFKSNEASVYMFTSSAFIKTMDTDCLVQNPVVDFTKVHDPFVR